MKKIVLYIGLILALPSEAQEDSFYQLQYREKVLHYNQDIKAADYQVSMRTEMTQSARANFLPKLSADADFKLILSSVITAVILFASHPHPILGIDAIKRVEPYFNSKMLVSVVPAYDGQIIASKEKATQLKMWLNY